MSNFKV